MNQWYKTRRTIFMAGWDACIAGRTTNPYTREDWRAAWHGGFTMCAENKPLPSWYQEWAERRAR